MNTRIAAPRIKAVLFDLDGTLVDSRRDLATGINLTRRDYGLPPLPVETVSEHVGDGVRKLVERCFAHTGISIDDALPKYKQHYHEHLADETTCYPGAVDTLERIRAAGISCGIITNKPEAATRALLDALHLARYFDVVIGGDSTPHLKPDPRALLLALESLAAAPGEALMVGDNHTDLASARAAGVRSVYCTYGFGDAAGHEADHEIARLEDLLDIVLPAGG